MWWDLKPQFIHPEQKQLLKEGMEEGWKWRWEGKSRIWIRIESREVREVTYWRYRGEAGEVDLSSDAETPRVYTNSWYVATRVWLHASKVCVSLRGLRAGLREPARVGWGLCENGKREKKRKVWYYLFSFSFFVLSLLICLFCLFVVVFCLFSYLISALILSSFHRKPGRCPETEILRLK